MKINKRKMYKEVDKEIAGKNLIRDVYKGREIQFRIESARNRDENGNGRKNKERDRRIRTRRKGDKNGEKLG